MSKKGILNHLYEIAENQKNNTMFLLYIKKGMLYFLCLLVLVSCNEGKTKTLPDSDTISLQELTIDQIHEHYRNGHYTSEQLVAAYLQEIKDKDSALNAISYINPNALKEARKLDQEFKTLGVLRPLHGIPLIVKDNFNTQDMPTTGGALALRDFKPTRNATMVQQLLDAGAIIIAKSNMAEWAFSAGTTHNPYNTKHVPAGSSGGTAAAVAANFGTIGLGTDTGNSIRGPSSHNALVGFRSTMGLTSRAGIIPLYLRNDIAGPMCRTVTDATRILQLIAKYDPEDPITSYAKNKVPENYMQFLDKNGLQGARIGVLRTLSDDNPDKAVTALFNTAIEDLKQLGATIVDPLVIPNFEELRKDQWCDVFRKDLEAYLNMYVKNDTIKTLEDVIRIGTESSYAEEALAYFMDAPHDRSGDSGIPCDIVYKDGRSIAFREAIEGVMNAENLDAIIYPSWNNKAATIVNYREEYLGDNSQIIAPHTGQPAFTVPMGFTSENLPTGLQFLGRMYAEPTLIKLCYAYEQGTKHRKSPQL